MCVSQKESAWEQTACWEVEGGLEYRKSVSGETRGQGGGSFQELDCRLTSLDGMWCTDKTAAQGTEAGCFWKTESCRGCQQTMGAPPCLRTQSSSELSGESRLLTPSELGMDSECPSFAVKVKGEREPSAMGALCPSEYPKEA